jgi:hypothetical protein
MRTLVLIVFALVLVMLAISGSCWAIILLVYLTVWTTRFWLRHDFDSFCKRSLSNVEPGKIVSLRYYCDFPSEEDARVFVSRSGNATFLEDADKYRCSVLVKTKLNLLALKVTRLGLWCRYRDLNGRISSIDYS